MIFRAWCHWLRTVQRKQRHSHRRTDPLVAETLEMRCVPTITVTGSATSPVITLSAAEGMIVSDNGTNLIFDSGSGPVVVGGAFGSVTSLRIRCTSSTANNIIHINLKSSVGLNSSLIVTVDGTNGGNDLIDASQSDVPVSLFGGSGRDTLIGGSANDSLNGGIGDDSLTGGNGNDDLTGGTGNDILSGDGGDDLCLGGDGADTISGGEGNDGVIGQAGNDVVRGNSGNDYCYGGLGNDSVDGGDGIDIVKGGFGTDTIAGSQSEAQGELEAFRGLNASDVCRNNFGRGNPTRANLNPPDLASEYSKRGGVV